MKHNMGELYFVQQLGMKSLKCNGNLLTLRQQSTN